MPEPEAYYGGDATSEPATVAERDMTPGEAAIPEPVVMPDPDPALPGQATMVPGSTAMPIPGPTAMPGSEANSAAVTIPQPVGVPDPLPLSALGRAAVPEPESVHGLGMLRPTAYRGQAADRGQETILGLRPVRSASRTTSGQATPSVRSTAPSIRSTAPSESSYASSVHTMESRFGTLPPP